MLPSPAAFILATTSLLHCSSANLFNPQPRIIGGTEVSSNRYPYTVALTTTGSNFFCGGSLIAPDVVLTAAHCLRGAGQLYKVAVARSDLTSKHGEVIRVMREIRHPKYSWSTDEYDIGLLMLSEAVSVVSADEMVKINADESYPSAGDMARTMGWGDTDPDADTLTVSYSLLEVDMPVISNEECRAAKGSDNGYTDNYESYIFDSMMCTFSPGQDACQGDSGGPLIIPGTTPSQDLLVGVTSWGIGCATKVFPGVFARVSYAYDWIADTVCLESSNAPAYLCETPEPSAEPTERPATTEPTLEPTPIPTMEPIPGPTTAPVTATPTVMPSTNPTDLPTTASPSFNPSKNPTESPSYSPTLAPTSSPSTSHSPSASPSSFPSQSSQPSMDPTPPPTTAPSTTFQPSTSRKPTNKPIRLGNNSLMIPISALLGPQEVEPKSLAVDLDAVDDDEYSSASLGVTHVGITLFGALISGFMML